MNLTPPFDLKTIDNPFGEGTGAVLAYYQSLGLLGHPGIDFQIPYGTPIPCATGATVSALLSENNPNLMAFRAVNTIYDDPSGVSYEIQYGHVSTMNVKVGQVLQVGDIVAEIGNTGDVFDNGVEVTEAQKLAGSTAGSHLHLQVRVIQKVSSNELLEHSRHYLNDGVGLLTLNGSHYWVPDWNNGYNGCVDPQQFFLTPLQDLVKPEITVLNNTTDASVRQSLIQLIVQQIKSYFADIIK